jgi:hypothetical protein
MKPAAHDLAQADRNERLARAVGVLERTVAGMRLYFDADHPSARVYLDGLGGAVREVKEWLEVEDD